MLCCTYESYSGVCWSHRETEAEWKGMNRCSDTHSSPTVTQHHINRQIHIQINLTLKHTRAHTQTRAHGPQQGGLYFHMQIPRGRMKLRLSLFFCIFQPQLAASFARQSVDGTSATHAEAQTHTVRVTLRLNSALWLMIRVLRLNIVHCQSSCWIVQEERKRQRCRVRRITPLYFELRVSTLSDVNIVCSTTIWTRAHCFVVANHRQTCFLTT